MKNTLKLKITMLRKYLGLSIYPQKPSAGIPNLMRISLLHRRIRSSGVIETVGSDPTMLLKPRDPILWCYARDPIPWCHWHLGIRSRVVIDTAGSNTAASRRQLVSLRLCNLLQNIPSRIPWCHWHRGIQTLQTIFQIYRWIWSHMQNGFSSWIRALVGIVW
jgi:hypothetical protein